MGGYLGRPDAKGGVPGVSGPRLPGAIAGTLHRQRGQPDVAARDRRRGQPGLVPGSSRCPRCVDREARGVAAGAGGAGPDPPPFRRRGRRRGHRPLAPGACASPMGPASAWRCATVRRRPISPRPPLSWQASKRILVFSMAGGTGRSYHADLGCGNTARRIHYLLGAGLAGRPGDPGTGPHPSNAPGLRPSVPPPCSAPLPRM